MSLQLFEILIDSTVEPHPFAFPLEVLLVMEQQHKSMNGRTRYLPVLAFPLALIWLEVLIKLWDFGTVWNRGLLYTSLFSISIGLLLSALCTSGTYRTNRMVSFLLLGATTLVYMVQAVYYTVMKTVFAVYSVSVATNATEFWKVGVIGTFRTLPILLPMAIPFVLLCVFGNRYIPDRLFSWKRLLSLVFLAGLLHGGTLTLLYFSHGGILSPWEVYRHKSNPELSLSQFGVLTSIRLDMQRMLFPAEERLPSFEPDPIEPEAPSKPIYDPNVLNIDFTALEQKATDEELRDMHHYFSTRTPSFKNEYTGKFAGKNLIMITAEAFSSWAVDPNLTPTLYRLSNEGFVFKNFYTPLWWVSTSDGEYVSCTSLIPKSGKQSFGLSASNSLPFCMGNQLREEGYGTRAYHDHTYTYYKRNQTHPNMGYDYKGLGNGLKMTPTWPESDVEMMKLTLPEFLSNAPFHTYYMTVSGHLEYSFSGNQMAYNHRNEVKDLPLSDQAKAYLACQIELDRAIAYLLEQLEASGQLENTVICLYPDHYPYGLSNKSIQELAGTDLSESLELYRSTMILWSGDQKQPVIVEKPCSNLDILPTLSNLFGLDYDSRLLMGRDILSSDPGLVIFSDTSFLTDLGTYNAKTDTFTPKEGAVVPEGYAKDMLQNVQDKFLYSGKILLHDYYRTLGLDQTQ